MAKPAWQWDESDILAIIANQIKENIELDYKRCDALQKTDGKIKEISKDVSSFANSAGGTIVYGVCENGNVPTAIDIGFDPDVISKEWIENIITSTIKPRINGLRINQLDLRTTNPGHVLYVVSIPQTIVGGPHQAHDKRYYKRHNFKSEPMEDYEIRDVFRRSEGPNLVCTVHVGPPGGPLLVPGFALPIDFPPDQSHSQPFGLGIVVHNTSPEPAFYSVFEILIDQAVQVINHADLTDTHHVRALATTAGRVVPFNRFVTNWNIPAKMPIFEGHPYQVTEAPLAVSLPAADAEAEKDYLLSCTCKAPKMPPREHGAALRLSGRTVSIVSP